MKEKLKTLSEDVSLEEFCKEELIQVLQNSRVETLKYINKLLEVEEKWALTNVLLKKLNSIRQKNELCKTISEGFLKITDSKACSCCLFDQDNNTVKIQKNAYQSNFNKRKLNDLIEEINTVSCEFLESASDNETVLNYFDSISGKNLIVLPIFDSKYFLGYLLLLKEDENFYKENIQFVNIFPEHIALILENISLYQESEKQNKQKIEFLAGISHEFKTPLNSIIGFTEILDSKNKSSDNFKYTKNILQSAKHLLTLIQDVLDVSKSQYKTLELNYSLFTPKDEIVKIINSLEEMFKEKKIDLNYTLTDIKISADIKRFRQLIYNLLSNAIKFNKQNGKIDVITYIQENKFVFEICDTGDGISKRDSEKIFNFFSQVNRNQLKRQLGSGVGLALCKMITDAHKGEISFKSKLKKGSCFWFSLPIV